MWSFSTHSIVLATKVYDQSIPLSTITPFPNALELAEETGRVKGRCNKHEWLSGVGGPPHKQLLPSSQDSHAYALGNLFIVYEMTGLRSSTLNKLITARASSATGLPRQSYAGSQSAAVSRLSSLEPAIIGIR